MYDRASASVRALAPHEIPTRNAIASAVRCSLEIRLNPLFRIAQQHTVHWLSRVYGNGESARRAARSQMSWIVAGFYPDAGVDQLCIATDYISWACALDDLADETATGAEPLVLGALFAQFDAVFLGERGEPANPPLVALRDIVRRLTRLATPAQMEAFFEANRAYFGAMLWEANNRAQGHVPDEETFVLLRPAAGAVPPFLQLMEPLQSISLSADVRHQVEIGKLCRLAGRVVCWINDLLSYEKERRRGDFHNLVRVYEVHRGLSPRDAVELAIEFVNAEIEEFARISQNVPSFGSAQDGDVRRYVGALESMIRTTLEWTLNSARYDEAGRLAGTARRTA
jgi:hypothetical protein